MLMSDQGEAQRYLSSVLSSTGNAPSNVYGDKGLRLDPDPSAS